MCRTVHAVLQTGICGIQMLVRVFMTVILMLENLIRMILQTLYNFISFLLQMLSLIPICVVFLVTARLKCFMCGGGGPCPVNRGGACDCLMSAVAIIIMFFIFRATGVLDKIFYSLGYAKARPMVYRFVPTPGDITECSRNDTDYIDESTETTESFEPSEPYESSSNKLFKLSEPSGSSSKLYKLSEPSESFEMTESDYSSTKRDRLQKGFYSTSDWTEFYTSTYLLTTEPTSDFITGVSPNKNSEILATGDGTNVIYPSSTSKIPPAGEDDEDTTSSSESESD